MTTFYTVWYQLHEDAGKDFTQVDTLAAAHAEAARLSNYYGIVEIVCDTFGTLGSTTVQIDLSQVIPSAYTVDLTNPAVAAFWNRLYE
jgi:hypothetical protein